MRIRERKEQGITLIALVITIIVLLILAGVSIALLTGDNGILTKATTASEETKKQGALEKVKLAIAESFDDKGKFNYNDFLNNVKKVEGYEKTEGEYVIVDETRIKVDSNTGRAILEEQEQTQNKPVEEDTEYSDGTDTAIIPKGFRVSNKTDEQTISKGLVVIAPDESEFVWIPVPTAVSDTEANGTTNKAMAINLGNESNPKYRGLLYDFTGTTSKVMSGCTTTTSEFREPSYLASGEDADNPIGLTEEGLQTEYNSIISSIQTYKGFYVGRYETSNTTATNSEAGTNGNIQSKAGVIPTAANNNNTWTWYGLYDKQQKYASTLTGTNIKSSMLAGSQYDAMLNWALQGNDKDKISSEEIGNHSGNLTTTKNEKYLDDKINNIYDLVGNLSEWTTEANLDNTRTIRGGYYNNTIFSPSKRYISNPQDVSGNYGSRLMLYV